MARDRIGLELKGAWSAVVNGLDARQFEARLRRQLVVAHKRIGRRFMRDARRQIRAKAYQDNSPITVILKGSSTPLVDTGQLFQGITFSTPDPFNLRLGVHKSKIGAEAVNIAIVLHEGATIVVTPAVRAAVFGKVSRQLGLLSGKFGNKTFNKGQRRSMIGAARQLSSKGAPRGAGRTVWRIPGRPYLAEPLNDRAFIGFVRDTWSEAVKIALTPPK